MQSKKMCIGVSSKVLQKELRAVFVIPKVYSFLLRKSALLRILCFLSLRLIHDMMLPFSNNCDK